MSRLGGIGRAAGASIALALLFAWSGAVADTVAAAPNAQATQSAAAVSVRFGGDTARTRVVLDLGSDSPGRVPVSQTAERLAIDVPVTGVTQAAGRGRGLVGDWTLEPMAAGARVSLDLAPGTVVQKRFLIPPSADTAHWRYVVDLSAADPLAALIGSAAAATALPGAPVTTPGAAAALVAKPPVARTSGPAPRATASVVAVRAPAASGRTTAILTGRQKVIVIDPGHGGHDTGARSLVRNEKDINLAAALALRDRLQRTGRYRVVLTRPDDTFIPLEARVRIARTARADLFISLHSDSAGQDPTPHGASVYTVSDHGVTRVGEVLGQHEWFSVAGDRRTDPGVGKILLDLTQRSTRNRSAEFATLLVDHLGQSIDMLPHGRRDASYFVLLAPDVPAVLLEMGFITNPGDELRLTDPQQRQAMMDHVADAIDDYFAPGRVIAQR
jgi:N-acetylmuramoyl-L-alanine amidase